MDPSDLFIAGASSGIGAATAKLFSKLGASLALTGRKEENLRKVGDECKSYSNKEVIHHIKQLLSVLLVKFQSLYCHKLHMYCYTNTITNTHIHYMFCHSRQKKNNKNSEYNQEIPQSQTAYNPMAS